MYSKLSDTAYQCTECYKVLKTEKGIKNHIKIVHALNAIKEKLGETVEDIRTTSTTVHEVIERLVAFWLENGIKVTFKNYPSTFKYCVSNSHNSPDGYEQNWGGRAGKPSGYPGWDGRWEGSVEILDIERWEHSLCFSDVIASWGNARYETLPRVDWIKTGTGGGGNTFQYSGMMFLYDFPKMHEEFINNGEMFKVLEADYKNELQAYRKEYLDSREMYKTNHKIYKDYKNVRNTYNDVSKMIDTAHKSVMEHLENEFNEQYNVEVPKPAVPSLDDKEVKDAVVLTASTKTTAPELVSGYERLKTLADGMSKFMKDNPEMFV